MAQKVRFSYRDQLALISVSQSSGGAPAVVPSQSSRESLPTPSVYGYCVISPNTIGASPTVHTAHIR